MVILVSTFLLLSRIDHFVTFKVNLLSKKEKEMWGGVEGHTEKRRKDWEKHQQDQTTCYSSNSAYFLRPPYTIPTAWNVLLLSTPGKHVQIHLDSVRHCLESMYLHISSLSSYGIKTMCYSSLIFCCLALQLAHNGHTNIC